MYRPTAPVPGVAAVPTTSVADPYRLACEVADLLGAMTLDERLRAYRCRAFSARELAIAAAWLPEEMPILNGEYEWLAIDAE
jgi:hypothetical protein